jgi:hypothetical protein
MDEVSLKSMTTSNKRMRRWRGYEPEDRLETRD